MSATRRFRGRKGEIVERLTREEGPFEIAAVMDTSVSYVYNVRSELRRLGVIFVGPHRQGEHANLPSREGEPGSPPIPTSPRVESAREVDRGSNANDIRQAVDTDPEVQRLRRDIVLAVPKIAILRERNILRQTDGRMMVEERRLQEMNEEGRLRSAIADICPNPPNDLLTNRDRYVRAMRLLLNEPPYRNVLQTMQRTWEHTAGQTLNAVLMAFFNTCILLKEADLLHLSESFVKDYMAQFFGYLTTSINPCFNMCCGPDATSPSG